VEYDNIETFLDEGSWFATFVFERRNGSR